MAPLLDDPAATAILTDFDGTLAPIITDPAAVQPLPGVGAILNQLSDRFGRVAVVSGRPVAFLADRLRPEAGLVLVGLYGLERSEGPGGVVTAPGAEAWRRVVEDSVARLESGAPVGVNVEAKGLTVTVHWRRDPARAETAIALAEAEAAATGLETHRGRMSIELRPPLAIDKGSVAADLIGDCAAACFMGDDLGDLPAFAALDRAAETRAIFTVKVAAVDDESSPEMAAAADVVVGGPQGAATVLTWLADRASVGLL